ncbi:MAG: nucleotidyltransferase domain-containing protein [FCB group bacterium]|nr:nucleotidyltransferase domain-containing protein [FCB group bacterium]
MEKSIHIKLKAYLSALPDIVAAFLFGSFARGTESDSSDIDIAILSRERRLPIEQKLLILDDLEQICGRRVDLVYLTEVSSILKHQVLKYGEQLICNDRSQLNQFKVSAIQEYLDLKRTRLPIENHLKDVSIYG